MTSAVHLGEQLDDSQSKTRYKKGGVTIRELPHVEPRQARTPRYQIRHQRSIADALVKIINDTPSGH